MTPYPYRKSAHDYGPGLVPRAIVIHMAEGGGTVGFLARPDVTGQPCRHRGVSCHFVIERSGRVVRMLPLDHIAGSLNPRRLRPVGLTPGYGPRHGPPFADPDGYMVTYGSHVAAALLTPAGYRNPNRHVLAIEVEGFARFGPSAVQSAALHPLISLLRFTNPSIRGLLGHADFQSYKACPGRLVRWGKLGGHGLWRPA